MERPAEGLVDAPRWSQGLREREVFEVRGVSFDLIGEGAKVDGREGCRH